MFAKKTLSLAGAALGVALAVASLAAPAPGAVIPTDGLTAWLRADNVDGLANTTLVGGSAVSVWRDSHTSNHQASQGNTAIQPSLTLNSLNGLPTVRFVGDALPFDTLRMPELIDATIFMVLKGDVGGGFALSSDNAGSSLMRHNIGPSLFGPVGYTYAVKNTGNGQTPVGTGNAADIGRWAVVASRLDDLSSGNDGGTPLELFVAGNYYTAPVTASTTISEANDRVQLGARGPANNALTGDIAEVLIYNRALSDYEVGLVNRYLSDKYRLPVSPGLVLYYGYEPPDAAGDALATDDSLNGRNGSLQTFGTGSFAYTAGGAPRTGSTQSLELLKSGANSARLRRVLTTGEIDFNTSDWTVATWFNHAAISADPEMIFHIGTGDGFGGENELYAYVPANASTIKLEHYNPLDVDLTAAGIGVGEWHHVAVVHDSVLDVLRFYVDGQLAGSDSSFALNMDLSAALVFGGHDSPGNFNRMFNGLLDDSAVWKRALSGLEIESLFTGFQNPLNALYVPEPSTLGLAALALAGLGGVAIRRRRACAVR